jgi:ABC-2 type transport system ATP-binding protein
MTWEPVRAIALTKRYGDRTVVDAVDLCVSSKRIFGVLGAEGSGKTTLLRMLAGRVRPTSGTVEIFGGTPGRPDALRRVGLLAADSDLHPHLSGRDNLWMLAGAQGTHGRVENALQQVGLAARAKDRVAGYPLVMRRRLGLAAALVHNPELLILDEPTDGLAPNETRDVRDLIRELAEYGHTVLLSTRLPAEVEALCDGATFMSAGRAGVWY